MKFSTWEDFEAYLDELGLFRMEPGQERINAVLDSLGLRRPPFTVAQGVGTNGKGSTCTMLASLAACHGFISGLHSSPHFVSVRERVRIFRPANIKDAQSHALSCRAGELLPEQAWLNAANLVMEHGGGKLTYFELITTMAVVLMREAGVELAVMETGLGGRFDATTALDADLVFFTPIDIDHAEVLGPTLRDIASDKAAAMRPGIPAISAAQKPEARRELEEAARNMGAALSFVGDISILPEALQPRRAAQLQKLAPVERGGGPDNRISKGPGHGESAKGGATAGEPENGSHREHPGNHLKPSPGTQTEPRAAHHHHHDEPPAPRAMMNLSLQGRHQLDNAALALRVWRELRLFLGECGNTAETPIEKDAAEIDGGEISCANRKTAGNSACGVENPQADSRAGEANATAAAELRGLSSAWLPGRMQFIESCGLCATPASETADNTGRCRLPHPPLIIDGAHNPHGLSALGHSLALLGIAPPVTIFSCLRDKQPELLVPHLRVLSGGLILVPQIQNNPRAMNAEELSALIGRPAVPVPDLGEALRLGTASMLERLPEAAEQSIHDCKYPMLICGSLYLLSEFFGLYPEYLE